MESSPSDALKVDVSKSDLEALNPNSGKGIPNLKYPFNGQATNFIINEICNYYHKDFLDNDLISELLFPNLPNMYYLHKEDINKEKKENDDILTQTFQIIFFY